MNRAKSKNTVRLLPFLPDGMVTDRSSPSRVRYAAKNAPLTAPGRSAHPPARKEREILGMANQNLLDLDRPSHGRPLRSKPLNERNRDVSTVMSHILVSGHSALKPPSGRRSCYGVISNTEPKSPHPEVVP